MEEKRDRHPARLGLETILSYSESSRGIVLPSCHLPDAHEQFFAENSIDSCGFPGHAFSLGAKISPCPEFCV
jgi:hypothetical protein